jgi:tetratricopeptide (TPR) repeat protein
MSGYFVGGEDANVIAVSLESSNSARRTVFHEYTHALVDAGVRGAPTWVNEGLAEVYSTFEVQSRGRTAVFGLPHDQNLARVREGPLLPLADVVAAGEDSPLHRQGDRRAMFYAQSWALVHYLLFGAPAREGQLARYLTLLGGGADREHAFRRAFECEPALLEGELRGYLRRVAFDTVRRDIGDPVRLPTMRIVTLSDAAARAHVAELLARHARTDEARALLESALQAAPGDPHVLAGLGRLRVRAGLVEDGLRLLERAAAAAPDDGAIVASLARALVEALRALGPFDRPDPRAVARARATAARAAALDPENAYAVAMRGIVELVDGKADQARAFFEHAIGRSPAREDYRLLLAQALIGGPDEARAAAVLERMMAGGSSPARDQARQLIDRLAQPAGDGPGVDARPEPAPPPADDSEPTDAADRAGAAGEPRVRADPATVTIDGREVHLLLRVTAAGETRVRGVVEAIVCRPSDVVLAVRGADRVLSLRADGLEAVDLIDHVGGTPRRLTCGPIAPPWAVLATYRAETGADTDGEAIAVEIVPRDYPAR